MENLDYLLPKIFRDLSEISVHFALVGGIAVGLRAKERFTRDIDFSVVSRSDEESEEIVRALQRRGYRLLQILERKSTKELAAAQFVFSTSSSAEPELDLLFRACGIEDEIVSAASQERIGSFSLPIATRAHLIAMKTLSASDNRIRDYDDLSALLKRATPEEIALAFEAVRTIEKRGYAAEGMLQRKLSEIQGRFGR